VIGFGTSTLFDLSAVLPHEGAGSTVLGQFLNALFGYTSTPEVLTFSLWLAYVVVVLALFLRPVRRLTLPAASSAPVKG
jgi:high-affinity Fe2+/Pb2+ permease